MNPTSPSTITYWMPDPYPVPASGMYRPQIKCHRPSLTFWSDWTPNGTVPSESLSYTVAAASTVAIEPPLAIC
jgi:hypothetical protein